MKKLIAVMVFLVATTAHAQGWTKVIGKGYTQYTLEVGDTVCRVVIREQLYDPTITTITLTPLQRGHAEQGDPKYDAAVRDLGVGIYPNGELRLAYRRTFAEKCGADIKTLPPEVRVRIMPYITLKPRQKA